ncbi:MAG TPA: threonine/serine dehydratase [Hyphomicrobiaceae bacterium]|nr:threonine/serine dehydratase [Hyphomicrobiaceae bacterium]
MAEIDCEDIEAAGRRISGHVRETPLLSLVGSDVRSLGLAQSPSAVEFKLELLQRAGSFKARGAFNSVLGGDLTDAGVVAASGGNHGVAVALAARDAGVRATIFVPEISSKAKVDAIRACGADVRVGGARYNDALEASERFRAETGAFAVHAYDAPATVSGQGTLALEWARQSSGLDTVLVAVGGGGLVAGMAAWYAGAQRRGHAVPKVIGVEPRGSRALHAAFEAGQPVDVDVNSVAADSLGARRIGDLPWRIARTAVAGVVLVDDDAIVAAQRALWRHFRLATEPGGAAAFAALASGAYRAAATERVGILVCGGNVDLDRLGKSVNG